MSKLFAIFGNPVAHSKSPQMHNYTFDALRYRACYTKVLLEDGALLRQAFFNLSLKGANITVPHKEEAYGVCDHLDPFAKKVGAVNTIVQKEGKLFGYNTDAPGFLRSIKPFQKAKSVVLLGAGGTAKAVAPILRESGYEVTILNRSSARLESFLEKGFDVATYDEAKAKRFDLVVNMTSVGLSDEALPAPLPLLEELLKSAQGVVEVIYGKTTPFMQLAKKNDIKTIDGSEMLLQQGILAFNHFTDHRFELEVIEETMRKGLWL